MTYSIILTLKNGLQKLLNKFAFLMPYGGESGLSLKEYEAAMFADADSGFDCAVDQTFEPVSMFEKYLENAGRLF